MLLESSCTHSSAWKCDIDTQYKRSQCLPWKGHKRQPQEVTAPPFLFLCTQTEQHDTMERACLNSQRVTNWVTLGRLLNPCGPHFIQLYCLTNSTSPVVLPQRREDHAEIGLPGTHCEPSISVDSAHFCRLLWALGMEARLYLLALENVSSYSFIFINYVSKTKRYV